MRTKLVKRHYCDYCNKGGMVGASMLSHEATCLRNPKRSCFLCEQPVNMPKLIEALWKGSGVELTDLRAAAGGCPACILAAILQYKEDPRYEIEVRSAQSEILEECGRFDYKKEKDQWYAEQSYNYFQ